MTRQEWRRMETPSSLSRIPLKMRTTLHPISPAERCPGSNLVSLPRKPSVAWIFTPLESPDIVFVGTSEDQATGHCALFRSPVIGLPDHTMILSIPRHQRRSLRLEELYVGSYIPSDHHRSAMPDRKVIPCIPLHTEFGTVIRLHVLCMPECLPIPRRSSSRAEQLCLQPYAVFDYHPTPSIVALSVPNPRVLRRHTGQMLPNLPSVNPHHGVVWRVPRCRRMHFRRFQDNSWTVHRASENSRDVALRGMPGGALILSLSRMLLTTVLV
ncbi:hypothetical protein ARMGADRAFT_155344 [Armillaria gallica]|uniref:Uncharacterized protein n=1 Tax=Armillaria gallica TaxID=47427 RepID=A0A2H3DHH1_ARMGA|nr:hypothetical protein ARMGADRAFT_155344 [Armillaria gallica]